MLNDALQAKRQQIWAKMLAHLPTHHTHPELETFYQHLRDYPQRQGKALRGLLVLLSYEAHSGADATCENWQQALLVAAGLELFQNWVLIHDDIEDDSDERRGQPTLHRKIAMPLALNVGDALHVYMWSLLHQLEHPQKASILQEFATMIHRTAEGQHLDLAWVAEGRFDIQAEDYMTMVTHKTAYYTVVSPLRLGALCAGAALNDASYVEAGIALGRAFQIRDDVLNLDENVNYGKEFAGDLYEAKRTLILAHTFAQTNPQETKQLRRLLEQERSRKSEEDIRSILGLIAHYGGLEHAQSVAESHAQQGLTHLQQEMEFIPASSAKTELLRLLNTVAYRRI